MLLSVLICCFQKRSYSFRKADKKAMGKEMGIFKKHNEGKSKAIPVTGRGGL
jgi:hypothetical protein